MCENGDCIPLESVCDGTGDCKRMDDESYGLCNCSNEKVSSLAIPKKKKKCHQYTCTHTTIIHSKQNLS